MTFTRRSLLVAAPALLLTPRLVHAQSTPAQTRGPFYPKPVPQESDFDLVKYNGGQASGEVIEMVGQVLGPDGTPIPRAVVEIWHCDTKGRYAHVGNNNGGVAEADFQGYGAVRADSNGSYRFRTIRPGVYPGRVRHIHAGIHADGRASLTTQMYFPNETGNARDSVFRRLRTEADRAALVARLEDSATPRYVFDIRLA